MSDRSEDDNWRWPQFLRALQFATQLVLCEEKGYFCLWKMENMCWCERETRAWACVRESECNDCDSIMTRTAVSISYTGSIRIRPSISSLPVSLAPLACFVYTFLFLTSTPLANSSNVSVFLRSLITSPSLSIYPPRPCPFLATTHFVLSCFWSINLMPFFPLWSHWRYHR